MKHKSAPIDSVKSNFGKHAGHSFDKEDSLQKKAEKLAEEKFEKGTEEFYKYAMGIFKKMNKIENPVTESKGAVKKKDKIRWNPVRGFFPICQSFDSSATPQFSTAPSIISVAEGLID